ncbi:SOS response-associated peptidase [Paraflavitalea pollutisoli]|uniref:SOS response-associated peptidase n=1 Tax=Paraflavitalea pollutisoli TaxID=3034143 RepID=UPI0023EC4A50|nr:SOS response-associated peptidase [Paraflavitalea sp. H1-2-19X]
MCYYNGVKVTKIEYIRLKQLEKLIANYDFLSNPLHVGFEYGQHPVLKKKEGEADFELVQMEWGFIPSYIRDRDAAQKMRFGYKDAAGVFHPMITTLNAVSEELLQPRKIYRQAALSRRCLVLSTGFYEWRHVFPVSKKTGKPVKTAIKYPYHISVKDKPYFFMAGIWQPWTDQQTGEYIETFAIITTAANTLMGQVHNSKQRMPTLLPEDLAFEWLLEDLSEERITAIARYQYPAADMEAYSIAKDFREAVDPSEAFAYEDLPALEAIG